MLVLCSMKCLNSIWLNKLILKLALSSLSDSLGTPKKGTYLLFHTLHTRTYDNIIKLLYNSVAEHIKEYVHAYSRTNSKRKDWSIKGLNQKR